MAKKIKRHISIILIITASLSLATTALAVTDGDFFHMSQPSDETGLVTLNAGNPNRTLSVSMDIEGLFIHGYRHFSVFGDAAPGDFVSLIIVTEVGYYIERWNVETNNLELHDTLTQQNEDFEEPMLVHSVSFIMPDPAVDIVVTAVIASDETQTIITPPATTTPMLGTPTQPETQISVVVNGSTLDLDVPPYLLDGRTLVPLRAIFEALGVVVDWDPEEQTIQATGGGTDVVLMIGSNIMFRNGVTSEIDVPPMIINQRTLVPARVIAESFGAGVDWDPTTNTVTITQ